MKFVWFAQSERMTNDFYHEVMGQEDVRFVYKKSAFGNRFLSKLFILAFSAKINKRFYIPNFFKKIMLQTFWKKSRFDPDETYVFIFHQGWFDRCMAQWLKEKHPEVKTVYYCDDTLSFFAREIRKLPVDRLYDFYDYVYCYNPEEVEKYGYTHCHACLSKVEDSRLSQSTETDLSFIGYDKGRLDLLTTIHRRLQDTCKMDFLVVGAENKTYQGVSYRDTGISYADYLCRECEANCLLEIVKGDTKGETLRCWEAVYYNKKLLTNWQGITQFPFYDPRYMRYFSSAEDIDMDFVRNREPVDYGYKGENSPRHFLDELAQRINNDR